MDFEKIVKSRKSVKIFQKKDVSEELVNKIIEISNLSPSAGNLQARSVIVVRDKKLKQKVSEASFGKEWIIEAPVILIVFANLKESESKYGKRGKDLYALQDATIFTSYIQLAASSFGLSSRWIGHFDEKELKKLFKISTDRRPIAIIPLAFPEEEYKPKPRKSIKELILKEI